MDNDRDTTSDPHTPGPYTFLEASTSPLLECRDHGRLSYSNQAAEQLVTELGLKSAWELLPTQHLQIVKVCFDSSQSTRVETIVGDRVITWSYHPLQGESAVYLLGIDVAEHTRSTTSVLNTLPMAVLNQMTTGIVAVDQGLKVLFVNPAAMDLFSSDGLSVQKGNLVGYPQTISNRIQQMVVDVCQCSAVPTAISIPRPSHSPLEVLVSPVHAGNQSVAIVYLFESQAPQNSITGILKSLYSLTSAEAQLVELLVEGHSLGNAGTELNISKQTAKNQLQAAYSKTGTHRQSELVIKVLTGAAGAVL